MPSLAYNARQIKVAKNSEILAEDGILGMEIRLLSVLCPAISAIGCEGIGVTPPFVKNCTLRREITRGIGLISGPTGLTLDKSSI
jgi:hypothetical protein